MSRRLVFVTCRLTLMSRRLIFITCRVMFMSRRLVFVTRRLTFMSRRIAFVTCRLVFFTCRLTFMSCRIVFVTRRLVYFTRRLTFMSRRIVFVTRQLTIMSQRIVFVTRRVQKRSYIKFSKSLIFVSSSQSPTGILFPQLIHLCYIGVLWSVRVGNYLRSSFRLGECDFAKVALIVDYVYLYSYDDSMCVLWRLSYASMS